MQRTAQLQIQASEIANNTLMSAYDTKMTQQPVDFMTNFAKGTLQLVGSLVSQAGSAAASYYSGGMAGGGGGGAGQLGGGFGGFTAQRAGGYTQTSGQSSPNYLDMAGGNLTSGLDYMNNYGNPSGYGGFSNPDTGYSGAPNVGRNY
jgi:hypothetical protein